MGSLRRPLFIGSAGWHDSMAQDDTLELGGLKMYGSLDANSNKITNLTSGSDPGDAVNKSQLDTAVITGAKVRELILHKNQLSSTQGVLAAIALVMQVLPIEGDTITLTDGTTTRTYGAGTGGDVQYTIGGTIAATMTNLAAAITGDASGVWSAVHATTLTSIDADGAVVIYEEGTAGTASKAYGTWTTQTDCEVVNFYNETEYTKITLTDLPSSSPANTNFGFRRAIASVVAGEVHWAKSDDVAYYWDDDGDTWVTTTGSGSIPDATSASGGGTKGKVGFDSDKGLSVSSGIAGISLTSNAGLAFNVGTGALETVVNTDAGMSVGASGLAVALTADSGLEFDGEAGTLQAVVNGSEGMSMDASGLAVKVDSTTVTFDGSGNLQAIGSAEAQKIENTLVSSAGGIAVKDPVYQTATASKIDKADAATDAKALVIGIARTAAVNADDPCEVVSHGPCTCLGGAGTAGSQYYLQSGGGIGTGLPGAGLRVIEVGIALNTNDLFVRILDHGKRPAA